MGTQGIVDRSIRRVPIAPTPRGYALAKRTIDVVASGVGLILTSPILAGVAVAIKASSPGPVLFRQERVGLGGRPFVAYKLRSMRLDADEGAHQDHVRQLMTGTGRVDEPSGDAANATATANAAWRPIARDPRVTGIGRIIRRTHLDELPQLLNVLRGEMSLVGPRPPIPYEVELYKPWHLRRLSVVPGLTGLWQATGWGSLGFDDGVRLDLEYIERRSIAFDLRLIVQTLVQIVRGRQF